MWLLVRLIQESEGLSLLRGLVREPVLMCHVAVLCHRLLMLMTCQISVSTHGEALRSSPNNDLYYITKLIINGLS